MPDEITFMDLASILKITPNTPLEKLGSALNASIFDASNVAGTLKQKGLIEFTANYPGPNAITITDQGKALLQEADSKAASPLDALDESILTQLSGGKRIPVELQNTLNLRPRDLAMRLYKLNKQSLLIYELKNGGVELLLTEQGFLRAKGGTQLHPASVAVAKPAEQAPSPPMLSAQQPQAQPAHVDVQAATPDTMPIQPHGRRIHKTVAAAIIAIIVIVAVSYYLNITYLHLI